MPVEEATPRPAVAFASLWFRKNGLRRVLLEKVEFPGETDPGSRGQPEAGLGRGLLGVGAQG